MVVRKVTCVTYLRNDCRYKIDSSIYPISQSTGLKNTNIFQWQNVSKAVVDG